MNRLRAKQLLPIIEAFANGEEIECRSNDTREWVTDSEHTWTTYMQYRIKPKPREGWIKPEDLHNHGMFCDNGKCIKVIEVMSDD